MISVLVLEILPYDFMLDIGKLYKNQNCYITIRHFVNLGNYKRLRNLTLYCP
jgi:hypothetical protein